MDFGNKISFGEGGVSESAPSSGTLFSPNFDGSVQGTPSPADNQSAQDEHGETQGETQGQADGQEDNQTDNRKRKKQPAQRRIDQLVYELGVKDQEKAFVQNQLNEYANREQAYVEQIQALQQLNQQKEKNESQYYAGLLEAQEEKIAQELLLAKQNNDYEMEVQKIKELGDIQAKKVGYDVFKANQSEQRQYQESQQEYIPIERPPQIPTQPAAPVDYEFQQWVNENPWYVNNPSLKQETDEIANQLAKYLSFNNQSQFIGTPEFRDAVKQELESRYGFNNQQADDQQATQVANPMNAQRHQYFVEPVNNKRTTNMADQYIKNNSNISSAYTTIPPEHMAMAKHLPNKPGESELQKIERYKKAMTYPPAKGGINGQSSPYRLTIYP